ncbi:hypothetical protein L0B52_06505 [Suttonella sp. R2A3]|uniref:nucleoside recognition domain-containing protein n=1 Tax=Suttonella sp. R2A3 TaxID=2908648 RepID=UPI001F2FCA63|nr:nucleoside recognition domain-containing protein [Suttonella sp. R2A3]UJF23989.1 hypothetical protein L0B52_06505 [Suttonella sp. R2A3]
MFRLPAAWREYIWRLGQEIVLISWALFKILIPVLILVRLLTQWGVIDILAEISVPVMQWIGLPGEASLTWMVTMAAGIYPGMAVFFSSELPYQLSVAQVSVLGALMLISHSLPVEGAIARRVGVRWSVTLSLRVIGGLCYAALLHFMYQLSGWLDGPNTPVVPKIAAELNWREWLITQLQSLWWIFCVISALVVALRLLRFLGIERLIAWLLGPLLRLLGIGKKATDITLIGITLGLSYGGGLLIRDADSGRIPKRDIFTSMCLIGLLHSLIEDTLLILLMGADLSAVVYGRLLFAFVVIALLSRWINRDQASSS